MFIGTSICYQWFTRAINPQPFVRLVIIQSKGCISSVASSSFIARCSNAASRSRLVFLPLNATVRYPSLLNFADSSSHSLFLLQSDLVSDLIMEQFVYIPGSIPIIPLIRRCCHTQE